MPNCVHKYFEIVQKEASDSHRCFFFLHLEFCMLGKWIRAQPCKLMSKAVVSCQTMWQYKKYFRLDSKKRSLYKALFILLLVCYLSCSCILVICSNFRVFYQLCHLITIGAIKPPASMDLCQHSALMNKSLCQQFEDTGEWEKRNNKMLHINFCSFSWLCITKLNWNRYMAQICVHYLVIKAYCG